MITGRLLIGILLMTTLWSCKFSRPLVSIPCGKYVSVDSTTHYTTKSKHFNYLCFRNGISIGGGSAARIYNTKGQMIQKNIDKRTHAWMMDRNNRYYSKEISYDTTGQVSKIHYKIFQNMGMGGKTVYENTVVHCLKRTPAK